MRRWCGVALMVLALPAWCSAGPLTLEEMIAVCPEMQELCAPDPTATPIPTPTLAPTHTPVGRTPKPTQAPSCDNTFTRRSASHYSSGGTFEIGKLYTYCVDLPAKNFPLFEMYTINLGNSSCGDLSVTATSPSGRKLGPSTGPAPVVRPVPEAGRWRFQFRLLQGCNRYQFHIAY